MLKIIGIESEEYSKGRWDIFKIELVEDLIEPLSGLFKDLGFDERVILDLDMYYPLLEGFYPFYSKEVKAYMYAKGKILNLIFDTALPKKKIDKLMEKYFKFPE